MGIPGLAFANYLRKRWKQEEQCEKQCHVCNEKYIGFFCKKCSKLGDEIEVSEVSVSVAEVTRFEESKN